MVMVEGCCVRQVAALGSGYAMVVAGAAAAATWGTGTGTITDRERGHRGPPYSVLVGRVLMMS